MSRAFGAVHRALFRTRLHDPSCPFVLSRRALVASIRPRLGRMPTGLWWEFSAVAHRSGATVREVPAT